MVDHGWTQEDGAFSCPLGFEKNIFEDHTSNLPKLKVGSTLKGWLKSSEVVHLTSSRHIADVPRMHISSGKSEW